tara:strand:+ start:10788 stop:12293 length:1506 start_codon:yes stop_codon:yes gene_type:complete
MVNASDLLGLGASSGGCCGSLIPAELIVQGNVTANQPIHFVSGVGISGTPGTVATGVNADSATVGVTYDTTSISVTEPSDMNWVDNGNKLTMSASQNNVLLTLDASTPYDITTLTFTGGGGSVAHTNASGVEWSPDGLIYNVRLGTSSINTYSVSVPFKFNGQTLLGSNTAVGFAHRGLNFLPGGMSYISVEGADTIIEAPVATAYRAHTAFNSPIRTKFIASGLAYVRFISDGYQIIAKRGANIEIYDLLYPYNISDMVLRDTLSVGSTTISCAITDPSGNFYTVDPALVDGLTTRRDNTSIPATFNILDSANKIGFSTQTITSGNIANLLLKNLGSKISYSGAVPGDILYLNSLGNLELNTSGVRLGICIEADNINLDSQIITEFGPTKSFSKSYSSLAINNPATVLTSDRGGLVLGVYLTNGSSSVSSSITRLLVTYDEFVDVEVPIGRTLAATSATGTVPYDLYIPLEITHKGPIEIKVVTGGTSTFYSLTYYKEVK